MDRSEFSFQDRFEMVKRGTAGLENARALPSGEYIIFVGEEPFDQVTAKYNETMKALLPQHGVEAVEIPRLAAENGEIISASKVREYIYAGRGNHL